MEKRNDLFQKQYGLSPTALRKQSVEGNAHTGQLTVSIGYRPPYQWEMILGFLSMRAIPGVESVADGEYRRTVSIMDREWKKVRGFICVRNRPEKNRIELVLDETLISVLPQVMAQVKKLFDLYCDPEALDETLEDMNEIMPGLWVSGTRIPGCFEPFEMAVRAVLGQQITVKAASTLAGRIAKTYGTPIETGIEGLTHTFPSAEDIVALSGNMEEGHSIEEHLGVLGVIASRSRCILGLAQAMTEGKLTLDSCAEPETEMKKLLEMKGIGKWTAKYIAMRTMGWPDAFLESDVGIKKALPGYSEKELLEMSERWSPWRSYATVSLWNSQ